MKNPAIFINCFEVPAGREDEFVQLWCEVNRYMRAKRGFLFNRLHRATSPDARFRFINYVQWATEDDWRAAHDEGFRKLVGRPEWRDFPHTPALCDVVCEHGSEVKAA